jgi:hypothetical protein
LCQEAQNKEFYFICLFYQIVKGWMCFEGQGAEFRIGVHRTKPGSTKLCAAHLLNEDFQVSH